MKDTAENYQDLFLWLKEKGVPEPFVLEPRCREGAGRGLFTSQSVPAKSTVLKIPSEALMNVKTLQSLYPCMPLEVRTERLRPDRSLVNGVQLISLHLALHRPKANGEGSLDPAFGPYINSLPRDFDEHPLSWFIKQNPVTFERSDTAFGQKLLEHLPPSVSTGLTVMSRKFMEDWDVVKGHWDNYAGSDEQSADTSKRTSEGKILRYPDFLWAWLIVNTRSLYLRLFNRDLPHSNLTLCPLIDFANHTSSKNIQPGAFPQIISTNDAGTSNRSKFLAPGAKHDMTFVSFSDRELSEGEEVFLRYGSHCNRTLFVEYGFVDENEDPCNSEVNVEDLMEAIFHEKGAYGDTCKNILKKEGYTDQWCLFLSPSPPHPSYTLISALRLLDSWADGTTTELLTSWKAILSGDVSEDVDSLVRKNLERICQSIIDRSAVGMSQLGELEGVCSEETRRLRVPLWWSWAVRNVRQLWHEENRVAYAVLKCLQSGIKISNFP